MNSKIINSMNTIRDNIETLTMPEEIEQLFPVSEIKPVASNSTNPELKISYEEIENYINVLNNSVELMRNDWNTIYNVSIPSIQEYWSGTDSEAYIQKLTDMNEKMENSFKALELLSQTYEQAKNIIIEGQEQVKNYIDTI